MNTNHVRKHAHIFMKILILAIIVIVIAGLVILWASRPEGNRVPGGQDPVSTQQGGAISFDNLSQGQTINPPFVVTGQVAGWFFEGSFPVFLYNNAGTQIGVALAHSSQDWMTANPIPFSVTIPMTSYHGIGTLVFRKDNPSGDPQYDDSYTMNVVFQ